jgi:hypothetical protein
MSHANMSGPSQASGVGQGRAMHERDARGGAMLTRGKITAIDVIIAR